ncbi:hypothetical protein SNARM312S_06046 [Streptomyces narbonensis]
MGEAAVRHARGMSWRASAGRTVDGLPGGGAGAAARPPRRPLSPEEAEGRSSATSGTDTTRSLYMARSPHPVLDLPPVPAQHALRHLPHERRRVHRRQAVLDDVRDVLQDLLDPPVVAQELHVGVRACEGPCPQERPCQGLQRAVRAVRLVEVLAQLLPLPVQQPQQRYLPVVRATVSPSPSPSTCRPPWPSRSPARSSAHVLGRVGRHDQPEVRQFATTSLVLLGRGRSWAPTFAETGHPAPAQLLVEVHHGIG